MSNTHPAPTRAKNTKRYSATEQSSEILLAAVAGRPIDPAQALEGFAAMLAAMRSGIDLEATFWTQSAVSTKTQNPSHVHGALLFLTRFMELREAAGAPIAVGSASEISAALHKPAALRRTALALLPMRLEDEAIGLLCRLAVDHHKQHPATIGDASADSLYTGRQLTQVGRTAIHPLQKKSVASSNAHRCGQPAMG